MKWMVSTGVTLLTIGFVYTSVALLGYTALWFGHGVLVVSFMTLLMIIAILSLVGMFRHSIIQNRELEEFYALCDALRVEHTPGHLTNRLADLLDHLALHHPPVQEGTPE